MAQAAFEFGGEEVFSASPDRLYAALTDPEQLAATIPDLQSFERVDERTLRCVVRPGFSFLRGTLKLEIVFTELKPPASPATAASAAMQVDAKGIGVDMEILSQMQIEPAEGGSRLIWKASVTRVKGLVATISKSLIHAAAGQVARQTWERVRQRLA